MTDDIDDFIQYLIEEGALVLDGISDDGEAIYLPNIELLQELAPEFLAAHYKDIEDTLIDLYEKDLVNIEVGDDGEIYYGINKGDGEQQAAAS